MKALAVLTLLAFAAVSPVMVSANTAQATASQKSNEMVIPVEGMTCGGCEGSIEKKVKQVAGVVEVKADHKAKSVTVKTDGKAKMEDIKAAIVKAGYTPK